MIFVCMHEKAIAFAPKRTNSEYTDLCNLSFKDFMNII